MIQKNTKQKIIIITDLAVAMWAITLAQRRWNRTTRCIEINGTITYYVHICMYKIQNNTMVIRNVRHIQLIYIERITQNIIYKIHLLLTDDIVCHTHLQSIIENMFQVYLLQFYRIATQFRIRFTILVSARAVFVCIMDNVNHCWSPKNDFVVVIEFLFLFNSLLLYFFRVLNPFHCLISLVHRFIYCVRRT